MFRYFAILTIVLALVIPRVAWSAHVSVDSPTRVATAMHIHHEGHSHVIADGHDRDGLSPGSYHVDETASSSDDHRGIPHNHVSAEVLSMMSAGSGSDLAVARFYANAAHGLDTRSRGAPSTARNSLLRPPRTI